jgi:hypothetical protein
MRGPALLFDLGAPEEERSGFWDWRYYACTKTPPLRENLI